jgi:hypothetical protein
MPACKSSERPCKDGTHAIVRCALDVLSNLGYGLSEECSVESGNRAAAPNRTKGATPQRSPHRKPGRADSPGKGFVVLCLPRSHSKENSFISARISGRA